MSVVAIVGRPNVGKSALFNRLIGKRKALVSDMPGVTRDRHYAQGDWCGVDFTLIDTGGLSFDETDAVEAEVHKQSIVALEEADVVICLFDGREGATTLDHLVVDTFRKSGKPIVFAANKVDTEKNEDQMLELSELGVDLIPVSAEHGRNIDALLDEVIKHLPKAPAQDEKPAGLRIAIIGRPNVGKSTIINHLASEERVVAHDMPGTTRDTIDVDIEYEGNHYIFVDTAGIKKRARTTDKIDKFSILKSLRAVDDADIVFVVLDGPEGLTHQDQSLIAHAFGCYRATALLVTKWDLVKESEKEFLEEMRFQLGELRDIPISCVSGETGENCNTIYSLANTFAVERSKRVTTSELNRFLLELTDYHPPPDYKGRQVKLKYITQVDVNPPVFVVFTNQPKGIKTSYRRFILNGLRKLLGGAVIPLVVKYRAKK